MSRRSHSFSFIIALSLHGILACLLFLSIEPSRKQLMPSPSKNQEIINAVVIDNTTLENEIKRLDDIEQKKREQELARQRELKRKQLLAQKRRKAEEARLAEIKRKKAQMEKEAKERKLAEEAELKAKQEKIAAEKKRLEEIKQQQEQALLAKQQAEKEQQEAEMARIAAEESKRLAEEKARLAELERAKEEQRLRIERQKRYIDNQISQYAAMIKTKVHQFWRQPLGVDIQDFTCKILVKLLPSGDVIEVMVIESSGNLEFDRSTELAVRKASPLPIPDDPTVAKEFRQFTFTFRPEAV